VNLPARTPLLIAGGAVLVVAIAVLDSRRADLTPATLLRGNATAPVAPTAGTKVEPAFHRTVMPRMRDVSESRKRKLAAKALLDLDQADAETRRDTVANLEVYSKQVIRKALSDGDPVVREEAIRRLAFLNCDRDVAECLIAAAGDPVPAVCEATLAVIAEMEAPVREEYYAAAVHSGNEAVRQRAVEHLLELEQPGPDAIRIIQAGLTDTTEAVRESALEVIRFHYDRDFKSAAEAAEWLKTRPAAP